MKKNLFLAILFLLSGYAVGMEENAKLNEKEGLNNQLSRDGVQLGKNVVTLEDLPADLLLLILVQFAAGEALEDSLKAAKSFQRISRRFNDLIKDKAFVKNMVNYWSKKYRVPKASIPISHPGEINIIPDELLWLILNDLNLIKEEKLEKEMDAVSQLRKVNKRFEAAMNKIEFIDKLLNYWFEKYKMPQAHAAILLNLPGSRKWLSNQDKKDLNNIPVCTYHNFKVTDWPAGVASFVALNTPIFLAIKTRIKEVLPILIEKGVDLNQTDSYGQTILSAMVYNDWLDIVELLIEKGADVDYAGKEDTPLITAISKGRPNIEMVKLLLQMEADPNEKGKLNLPPLQRINDWIERKISPKNLNVYKEIKALLKEHGALD